MKRMALACALAAAVMTAGCATKSRCDCCQVQGAPGYSINYVGKHQ